MNADHPNAKRKAKIREAWERMLIVHDNVRRENGYPQPSAILDRVWPPHVEARLLNPTVISRRYPHTHNGACTCGPREVDDIAF